MQYRPNTLLLKCCVENYGDKEQKLPRTDRHDTGVEEKSKISHRSCLQLKFRKISTQLGLSDVKKRLFNLFELTKRELENTGARTN